MSYDVVTPIDEVVTKAEFARRCNVTPGRVSQWISEGKLSGDALVGDGRASKICVAPALTQLKRKLDIIHRIGNGHATRLDHLPPESAPSLPLGRGAPENDPIDGEIKLARLKLLQEQKLKAEEDRALRTGRFVLAEAVGRELTRLAGQMLSAFEGALAGQRVDAKKGKKGRELRRERLAAVAGAEAVRSPDGMVDYGTAPGQGQARAQRAHRQAAEILEPVF
jgi:hypothetical protein